jgi:hypothetical protein
VGSWVSSWVAARRRLGVGSGESEREGARAILQRLPRVPPFPCVHLLQDKENKRGREKGGRLGWSPGRFCKGREERRRRKEEEMRCLAEIHLNFEKFMV